MNQTLKTILPLAMIPVLLFIAFVVGMPSTTTQAVENPDPALTNPIVAQDDEGDSEEIVVTVEVTREVTREVTVVVTPTFTPLPPTPTPLPPELTVDDDHFIGDEDAPVKVVEFSDFQCGFCARFYQQTLTPLTEHYGDLIQFVYRDYPIFGDESVLSAMGAECAGDQGLYWEFHNLIFDAVSSQERPPLNVETLTGFAVNLELDTDEWSACIDDEATFEEIVIDANTARDWGVTGTPTFFVNGQRLVGAQPLEVFFDIIDAELIEAGYEPPERE